MPDFTLFTFLEFTNKDRKRGKPGDKSVLVSGGLLSGCNPCNECALKKRRLAAALTYFPASARCGPLTTDAFW